MESANLHKIRRKKPKTCFHTKIDKRKKTIIFPKIKSLTGGNLALYFFFFMVILILRHLPFCQKSCKVRKIPPKLGCFKSHYFIVIVVVVLSESQLRLARAAEVHAILIRDPLNIPNPHSKGRGPTRKKVAKKIRQTVMITLFTK